LINTHIAFGIEEAQNEGDKPEEAGDSWRESSWVG